MEQLTCKATECCFNSKMRCTLSSVTINANSGCNNTKNLSADEEEALRAKFVTENVRARVSRSDLINMYIMKNMDIDEIAKEIEISEAELYATMQRYGIIAEKQKRTSDATIEEE